MRRRIALLTLVLLAVAAPAAGARWHAQRAVVAECDRTGRAAEFDGRMRFLPGTDVMQMSFRLQVREPGEHWHRVDIPGFSDWVTSEPGHARYVYTKRVEDLVAPASYRVNVRFRWLDDAGAVLRHAHDRSRRCRQPDPRPDLRVTGVEVRPWAGGDARYLVSVRNDGRGEAPESALALTVGDAEPVLADMPALDRHEERRVTVTAPACAPGTTIEAAADDGDAIDERDEDDNALTIDCPQ